MGEREKACFFVLEGIDGSGTSTQAALLKDWFLSEQKRAVLSTFEPSRGPVGAMIRQILSGRLRSITDSGSGNFEGEAFDPRAVALLFAADRLDHLQNEVLPALSRGSHVISDRYLWSSLAYQGEGEARTFVRDINQYAKAPDLTIFLRVRPEVALARVEANRSTKDSYENIGFLKKVAAHYDEILQESPLKVRVIDGEQDSARVQKEIQKAILGHLLA